MQPSAREPIGLLAAAVRRAIKAAVAARAEPLGVSSQQFWMLVAILEAPGCTQAQLAARMRADEPSVSRVMRTLVLRGWVRTHRGEDDRRCLHVALTSAGRALARRLQRHAAGIREAVEQPLTAEEAATTRASLQKVAESLGRLAREKGPGRAA